MTSNNLKTEFSATRFALGAAVVLGLSLLWGYWTTLSELAVRWGSDPQYSHGYLVPVFAAGFLWYQRKKLVATAIQSNSLGIVFLGIGFALRLAGTYFYFDWLGQVSLLPCLLGVMLVAGGWHLLRWSLPAIAFLVFMIPLPYRVEVSMAYPLQRIATLASTYAMQTLGLPAIAEGNVILLNEVEIGIIEACSGLRMLVIFFAISTAVALLIQRSLWERIVIVLSALPIAVLSNIIRITVTGVLHETVGSEIANRVFHDLAGWLMMPLALGLLWIELKLLLHLLVAPELTKPIPVAVQANGVLQPVRTIADRLEPKPPAKIRMGVSAKRRRKR